MQPSPATAVLIEQLTAEAEANRCTELPDPLPENIKVTRRTARTAPVSVRLRPEERAALNARAASLGVGPTKLAHDLIVDGLEQYDPDQQLNDLKSILEEAIAPLAEKIDQLVG